MLNRVVLVAMSGLAAVGCATEVPVDVKVVVPAEVRPDAFRLFKRAGGQETETLHPVNPSVVANQETKPILFRVNVPDDGTLVTLGVQAVTLGEKPVHAQLVLAYGESNFSSLTVELPVPVKLYACATPASTVENSRCLPTRQPSGSDGGAEAPGSPPDTDAGADATGGGEPDAAGSADAEGSGSTDAGGGADAWTAPACENPTGGSPAPVINRPATVSAGCDRYCTAMEVNCPTFHRTKDRCLHSCEKVAWDQGAPGDGQDTLGCRTAYAESSFPQDRTRQIRACTAAMPRSEDGSCGTPCMIYCRMGNKVCPSQFPPFLDCLRACGRKEADLKRGAQGIHEWLICRLEQLEEAVFDPRLCSAAGVSACGFCGPAPFSL